MKRVVYLFLLLSIFCSGVVAAQDSLFFYKGGDIIYRETAYKVDSVTFLAPDYYVNSRSAIVFNNLQSNNRLTLFARMIQLAGFEKKLDNATIWAPVNSALSLINLSDTTLVKRIVTNHITALKINTASASDSLTITMFNNKHYVLKKTTVDYSISGIPLLTTNQYVANSIIHTLNGYLPFKLNIWEYITQGTGHDLMKTYVNSHAKTTFNPATGNYVTTNDLLDQLSFINNEDSLYSAIIPSDAAWKDAYSKIYPYCIGAPIDTATDSHDEATKFAIIQNNFYRGNLNISLPDSVYTATSGYQLKSAASILEGAQISGFSNGTCYTVDQLKMYNPEYWNKEIRVEAEKSNAGRTTSNYSATPVSSSGSGFDISQGIYLRLDPTSSSTITKLNVTFPIPNTFSTKYNIYCVIVPASIIDSTDKRPNKVRFYLSYVNSAGIKVYNASIDANNQVQLPTKSSAVFTTTPSMQTQKLLVASGFQFPYCNFVSSLGYNSSVLPTVSLKVENAVGVTASDLQNFNRTLRIDCIILEPVK